MKLTFYVTLDEQPGEIPWRQLEEAIQGGLEHAGYTVRAVDGIDEDHDEEEV